MSKSGGNITGTKPGLLSRAVQAARYTVSGIKPDTWMSPLNPLPPYTPIVYGRQYDYNVGRNLFYTPRGDSEYTFDTLRNFSRASELVRLAIETRQDQMDSLEWQVLPIDERNGDENDPRIKAVAKWLEKPDGIHDWGGWLRVILEELYVTDAVSLLPRFTRGGGLYSVDIIDGSTIFPVIDQNGRQPLPPDPAYQQILKGVPKVDYTSRELIYAVRKVQVNTPYGYPVVEQIIKSASTDIERIKYQLAYFTEGSVPDSYMIAPEKMSMDLIKAFEDHFNSLLAGNAAGRRQVPVVPFGMEFNQLKQPPLKDDFDEWIWRKIAFAFGLPPNALVKQVNRATAQSDQERSSEEGLTPVMVWVRRLINRIIREYWGFTDITFRWKEARDNDAKEAADIDSELVRNGVMAINEVRHQRGLEPIEGGDLPMLATATGFVPINSALMPPPEEAVEGSIEHAEKMIKKKSRIGLYESPLNWTPKQH